MRQIIALHYLSGSILFAIEDSKTFQQTTKADDFCCDWRFKGYPLIVGHL